MKINEIKLLKQLDDIFKSILECANMDELAVLKERIMLERSEIKNEYLQPRDNVPTAITSRVETGPIPMGWGKGKDE
jgi:hypothetical protein